MSSVSTSYKIGQTVKVDIGYGPHENIQPAKIIRVYKSEPLFEGGNTVELVVKVGDLIMHTNPSLLIE